ncbi:MAG TPA: hypothetical protein VFF42_09815, partial [Candidatus Eremiobacteraceae bacterium]|nr:hypothetical protein [Candidatus Eremiobacteraceae bacterium]
MPQTLTPSFSLGVNYPWSTYGYDFGSDFGVSTPHTNSAVAADFARIRDCGATIVRWFLFGVGNSGIDCSSAGIPRGPHQSLFPDVAAALALARQNNLQICFSLIDFLWLQDPAIPLDPSQPSPVTPIPDSRKILQFAAGREAFLANILIPLFREFRAHPALFAWEIANEPEWAIHEFVPASPAT